MSSSHQQVQTHNPTPTTIESIDDDIKDPQFHQNETIPTKTDLPLITDSIHHTSNATLYLLQPRQSITSPMKPQQQYEPIHNNESSPPFQSRSHPIPHISPSHTQSVKLSTLNQQSIHNQQQLNSTTTDNDLKQRQFEMLLFESNLNKLDSFLLKPSITTSPTQPTTATTTTTTTTIHMNNSNTIPSSSPTLSSISAHAPSSSQSHYSTTMSSIKLNQNPIASSNTISDISITNSTLSQNEILSQHQSAQYQLDQQPSTVSIWKEQLKYPELISTVQNPTQTQSTHHRSLSSTSQQSLQQDSYYRQQQVQTQHNISAQRPISSEEHSKPSPKQLLLPLSDDKGGVYYTLNGSVDKPRKLWDLQNYKNNLFSFSEISLHNQPNDCWLVVENEVYDVTNMIQQHPGGVQSIIQFAGQVVDRHYHFHSVKAHKIWKQYRIGVVEHPQPIVKPSLPQSTSTDICNIM